MASNYRRGTGPNQLPQGTATQLNEDVPPANKLDLSFADTQDDIPVEYSPPSSVGDTDLRDSENAQMLTQPADPGFRPDPRSRGQGRVPRYVVRSLPLLMAAAKDPEAPRAIKALYRATVARLEAEQTEEG